LYLQAQSDFGNPAGGFTRKDLEQQTRIFFSLTAGRSRGNF